MRGGRPDGRRPTRLDVRGLAREDVERRHGRAGGHRRLPPLRRARGRRSALAAGLGIAGLAGWLPLAWRAPLEGGEHVLVLGATGSVGLVAVQVAKLLGAARVVAAGRSVAGLERAAEVGADATIRLDEAEDLVAAFKDAFGGEGPNYVFDPLWGEPPPPRCRRPCPGRRS